MAELESSSHRNLVAGEVAADNPSTRSISLVRLFFACMVAGGVQYGWALQLSLLTPYVQTLGIPHALSSLIWLCGPLAGFLVQPLVGLWSDRSHFKLGRRRPFIFVGCCIICVAVLVIGFSSDIGARLGDTKEDCSTSTSDNRLHAALVFVFGFWVLDFANNAVQGPARALMADISGQHGCNVANSIFCCWMAIGNILGYSSGASGKWHSWFPFLLTRACCEACANLKGAFLVAVVFLICCMTVTMILAPEVPLAKSEVATENAGFFAVFKGFKNLPPGMPSVFMVTALTWLSWFPFILYNTDWMGREIYHGEAQGAKALTEAFDNGVRQGAFGLLLNSIVLGISSFFIEPLCRKLTPKVVWSIANLFLGVCMIAMLVLGIVSMKGYSHTAQLAPGAQENIRIGALIIFTLLGFPLAVLYSVPFGVTATLAANRGGGQGLCTGVLNISIVIPQVIVALGAGPWDSIFDKGNAPAFGLAGVFAFISGILAIVLLPKLSRANLQLSVGGAH